MRITAIAFENFKGATGKVDFEGDRVLLTGPNGVGKTRILQAIRVALCGYDPELKKKGTAGLASGDPMGVALTLAVPDGPWLKIGRIFTATDAGGVKETVRLEPTRGEKTKGAADQRILKTLGSQTTAVDLGKLLDATAGERAQLLANLVGDQADVSGGTFVSAILMNGGVIPDAQTRAIAEAWDPEGSAAENMDTALKVLAGATSEAAAREKEATATIRRLEEQVAAMKAPAKGLPELETERDGAMERAGELRVEIGADAERGARLMQLQGSLADAEADVARWVVSTAAVVETLTDEETALKDAQEAAAEAKAVPVVEEPEPVSQALVDGVDMLAADVKAANTEVKYAANRLAEDPDGPNAFTACPVSRDVRCPVPQDVVAGQKRAHEKIVKTSNDAVHMRDLLKETLDAAVKVLNEAKARHRELSEEGIPLERKRTDLVRDTGLALARAEEARLGTDRAETVAQDTLRQCKERRDHLDRELAAAPGRLDVSELKKRLGVDDALVATLNEQVKSVAEAKALKGQLIDAEQAGAESREEAQVLRALQVQAKKAVGDVLADATAPVMGQVGKLLELVEPDWSLKAAGVGGGVEFLVDTGAGATPWTGLSGGEAVVFTAALSLALVRLHETPASFLMLEAAELDPKRLWKFLSALSEMGGDFDSILVASCHAPDPSAPAPWLIHQVGA